MKVIESGSLGNLENLENLVLNLFCAPIES